jgi:predicted Holliday junction resolvase-like endonuclease
MILLIIVLLASLIFLSIRISIISNKCNLIKKALDMEIKYSDQKFEIITERLSEVLKIPEIVEQFWEKTIKEIKEDSNKDQDDADWWKK